MAAASAMEVTAAAAHKGTRQTTPGARLLLPVDLMLVNYRTRVQIHKAIQESANHELQFMGNVLEFCSWEVRQGRIEGGNEKRTSPVVVDYITTMTHRPTKRRCEERGRL